MKVIAKRFLVGLGLVAVAFNIGCTVRGVAQSASTRIFREVHGLRARTYQITPISDDLRTYRRIEIHPLENLMLDQIPEHTVTQLNNEIIKRTQSHNRFDQVTQVSDGSDSHESALDQ